MRLANRVWKAALLAGACCAIAIPAIGQNAPESILPPGFGDPAPDPPRDRDSGRPADILPSQPARSDPVEGPAAVSPQPADDSSLTAGGDPADGAEDDAEEGDLVAMPLQDLPPGVRRSTARVGILAPEDGGLAANAFGAADGRYLSHLLRETRAPLASRWASILLRRALVSQTDTPTRVNGADWVAERAWLLIRMGEADAARLLVQSVDVDRYTPKMFQVAMQAALATSDPSGLCPLVEPASAVSREPGWTFARAMCAGLAGESAQASALIGTARQRHPGIDGLLAEKVIGAGGNTRRAVTLEWDGVSALTTWRYGLASATAAELPQPLLAGAPSRVRAWHARAPLFAASTRLDSADIAAVLGVYSSAALVDFYGAVADATDPSEIADTPAATLQSAYADPDVSARLAALRTLWAQSAEDKPWQGYARQILTARAAARIPVSQDHAEDSAALVSAMLAAGLDRQAARWASIVRSDTGSLGWALLAVAAPGDGLASDASAMRSFADAAGSEGSRRGDFFLAAMTALGRADRAEVAGMTDTVLFAEEGRWSQALARAVRAREPGTVAILCALGLQGDRWSAVSPSRLHAVISALRQTGFEAEARMIAAEAIMRS